MTTNQLFLGKFNLASNCTVTTEYANATVNAGGYFLAGYTNESSSILLQTVASAIASTDPSLEYSNVTLNSTSGKVSINLSTACNVTLDATLASIMGFSNSAYTFNTSATANYYPRYLWMPSEAPADYPLNLDASSFWMPESTSSAGRADEGTSWSVQGNLIYGGKLEYVLLPEQEAKITNGYWRNDFQTFWQDVVHAGQPTRILPDKTSYTATSFVTGIVHKSGSETMGSFDQYAQRYMKNYNGLWNINIPLEKYVPAS